MSGRCGRSGTNSTRARGPRELPANGSEGLEDGNHEGERRGLRVGASANLASGLADGGPGLDIEGAVGPGHVAPVGDSRQTDWLAGQRTKDEAWRKRGRRGAGTTSGQQSVCQRGTESWDKARLGAGAGKQAICAQCCYHTSGKQTRFYLEILR